MVLGMTEGFSISLSMTKKIGVKGITCTLLATFLLLSVGPSLLVANEVGPSLLVENYVGPRHPIVPTGRICFWNDDFECAGVGMCCRATESQRCCPNDARPDLYGYSASVEPSDMRLSTSDDISTTYREDGKEHCSNIYAHKFGFLCSTGKKNRTFSGGKWRRFFNSSISELGSEKSCNETVSTDTFQYRFINEDRRWARWVLPIASLAEADLDGPLRDLQGEEQVTWFKSRGATLEVEDHQTTPVPDNNTRSGSIGNPRP